MKLKLNGKNWEGTHDELMNHLRYEALLGIHIIRCEEEPARKTVVRIEVWNGFRVVNNPIGRSKGNLLVSINGKFTSKAEGDMNDTKRMVRAARKKRPRKIRS